MSSTSKASSIHHPAHSSERTPLLPTHNQQPPQQLEPPEDPEPDHTSDAALAAKHRTRKAIITWGILSVFLTSLLTAFIFFLISAPKAGQTYAQQATTIDISDIRAVPTQKGIEAKAKVAVRIDASRVGEGLIRNLGKMATWVARKVEVEDGVLEVRVPSAGESWIGRVVSIPAFVVDVRNGKETVLELEGLVEVGDMDVIGKLARSYVAGMLGDVEIYGTASFEARSGILGLGQQEVNQSMVFNSVPSLPAVNVTSLNLSEVEFEGKKAVEVTVTATANNPYAVAASLPFLLFTVSIPACGNDTAPLATATVSPLTINPSQPISALIHATIPSLPASILKPCPNSTDSPLDAFLHTYLHNLTTPLTILGLPPSNFTNITSPDSTPRWLSTLLSTIPLSIPLPGRPYQNLITSLSLTNLTLHPPSPLARPDSPASHPRISTLIHATIHLPPSLAIPLDVRRARALATLSYQGKDFGFVDIKEWVPAKSKMVGNGHVKIEADVRREVVNVTSKRVFARVLKGVLAGGVDVGVRAKGDVGVETAMGGVVVRGVEGSGIVRLG